MTVIFYGYNIDLGCDKYCRIPMWRKCEVAFYWPEESLSFLLMYSS